MSLFLNAPLPFIAKSSAVVVDPDFVFTVTTTGASETFTIPCQNVGTFDATVYWGDGNSNTITAYNDANLAHTYATAGDHQIRISGDFPNIYFNNVGDKSKVKSVDNIGAVGWESFLNAFYGCDNMETFTAGAGADTSSVTSMRLMFRGCTSVTSIDASTFDTSSVTTMYQMFFKCEGLTSVDVSGFDTSNHTDTLGMEDMFRECGSLTSVDVSSFDTSNVTRLRAMFRQCTSLTDIVGVENFDITGLNQTYSLDNFITEGGITTNRYDNLLINWKGQFDSSPTPRPGLRPNFGVSQYTNNSPASTARAVLTGTYSWVITDGGFV